MSVAYRHLIKVSLLLGGLLVLNVVHAQDGVGGCPPEQISYSGTDISSCGPMPDGYNQQSAQPQTPRPRWTDQWGAIATDGPGGHLGVAIGLYNKTEAQKAAIVDCQAKGGKFCKIEVAYDNECAAMVVGDAGHNSGAARTIDEAVRLGIKVCSAAGDTHCHAYYTGCSLPKRIQ